MADQITQLPKVIHRVWLGELDMPEKYVRYGETWRLHHPDWIMKLWHEGNISDLHYLSNLLPEYNSLPTLSGKSDIIRLAILAEHGGLYVDTDFEALKNNEPLLTCGFTTAWMNEVDIGTGWLASIPQHPFLLKALEMIPDGIALCDNPVGQTGPGLFYRVYNLKKWSDVSILSPDTVYPYNWFQMERKDGPFPNAYAVHHWAGSWHRSII